MNMEDDVNDDVVGGFKDTLSMPGLSDSDSTQVVLPPLALPLDDVGLEADKCPDVIDITNSDVDTQDVIPSVLEGTQMVQFVNEDGFQSSIPITSTGTIQLDSLNNYMNMNNIVHVHITNADGVEGVHVLHVPVSALNPQQISQLNIQQAEEGNYLQMTTPSLPISAVGDEFTTPMIPSNEIKRIDDIENSTDDDEEQKSKKLGKKKYRVHKMHKKADDDAEDEEEEITCESSILDSGETIASVVKQKKRSASEKLTQFLNRRKKAVQPSKPKTADSDILLPPGNSEVTTGCSATTTTTTTDNERTKTDTEGDLLHLDGATTMAVEGESILIKSEEVSVLRCANCFHEFQEGEPRNATILSAKDEESEVSVLEVLRLIFLIPKNASSSAEEEKEIVVMCEKCIGILQTLYGVFKDFSLLSHEEAYVQRKQKEIMKRLENPSSNRVGKKRGRRKKEEGNVEIEEEIDLEDSEEDEEEWITADISEDEDFKASDADLAAVGIRSSSSSSDSDTYVPVKKKRLGVMQKPKKRENNDDDCEKIDGFSSDEFHRSKRKDKTRKHYKSQKKTLMGQIAYICSLCDESFNKPRELKRHLQEFHKKTSMIVQPQFEDMLGLSGGSAEVIVTNNALVLEEGENVDEDEQSVIEGRIAIECRICGLVVDKAEIKQHFSIEHEGVLPYACDQCELGFDTEGLLRIHELKHNAEKPYKCKVCQSAFRRADELRTHFRDEHFYGEGEGGESDSNKRKQSCRQKNEKSIVPCEVCGKTFVRLDHLKLHLRIHTGEKPFACDQCGKTFSDPRGLAYHEVTHSTERPYCCTICGMTFKRLHHLNDHERNHRDDLERPFGCEICGKCFKYKKHLNSHKLTHGSSKDHLCFCGKAFNRKDNLRQHIKKVHGRDPGPSTMTTLGAPTSTTSSITPAITAEGTTSNTDAILTQTIPIDAATAASFEQIVYMTL